MREFEAPQQRLAVKDDSIKRLRDEHDDIKRGADDEIRLAYKEIEYLREVGDIYAGKAKSLECKLDLQEKVSQETKKQFTELSTQLEHVNVA